MMLYRHLVNFCVLFTCISALCPGSTVFIILDGSSSVSVGAWKQEKDFTLHLANSLINGRVSDVQVGVLTYGYTARLVHEPTQDLSSLNSTLVYNRQIGGNGHFIYALKYLRRRYFRKMEGSRISVILITDGRVHNNERVQYEANIFKRFNVTLTTIGVTYKIDFQQLRLMSTKSVDDVTYPNFYYYESFRYLIRDTAHNISRRLPGCERNIYIKEQGVPSDAGSHLYEDSRMVDRDLVKCQGKAVDLVYILDASSSIWPPHWEMIKRFLVNMTRSLVVSPQKTRIGVVTFTEAPIVEWRLGDMPYADDVVSGLENKVYQRTGTTQMSTLFRFLRRQMFSAAWGGRNEVDKVAIMITDGNPYHRTKAIRESMLLKVLTTVQLIVIGVGHYVDRSVLSILASRNKETGDKLLYAIEDYESLNIQLAEKLQLSLCHVRKTEKELGAPSRRICSIKESTDIVFVADPYSINPSHMKYVTNFIKGSVDKLPLGYGRVRIGFIPENLCSYSSKNRIQHNTVWITNQVEMLAGLDSLSLPSMSDYLRQARDSVFVNSTNRIAVIILDSSQKVSAEFERVVRDMRQHKTQVLIVYVGKESGVVPPTLRPSIFRSEKYSELESLTPTLTHRICSTRR